MEERLQKLLSTAGVCSRRKAEEYIKTGRVTVNGMVAGLGERADPLRDRIQVDGKDLKKAEPAVWLMLHKPRGYVTTLSDEKGRRTAAQLVRNCGTRVWPVGRLDLDSEGLLLFTNDGEGTHRLLHPSHEIEKEYHVKVKGDLETALSILNGPMELDSEPLAPAKAHFLTGSLQEGTISVVIHQGKNRQVRRMCAQSGLSVLRLKRVREGSLQLGTLKAGKWRYLTENEISDLLGG